MSSPNPQSGREFEIAVGRLLNIATLTAGAVIVVGIVWSIVAISGRRPAFAPFEPAAATFRSIPGILSGWSNPAAAKPLVLVQFGVVLLVLTPLLRVAFTLISFSRQRDWLYAAFALFVLVALSLGLAGAVV
jgi:uncharacterized membrane protein